MAEHMWSTDGRVRAAPPAIARSVRCRSVLLMLALGVGFGPTAALAQEIREIRVTPEDRRIDLGDTKSMTATATFDDGRTADVTDQARWASTAPDIVSVSNEPSSRGHATALRAGIAFISATLDDLSSAESGGNGRVRVPAKLVSLRIDPAVAELSADFTGTLRAIATFNDGSVDDISSDITWLSDNESVVTVSNEPGSNGEITAHRNGSAFIAAIDEDTGISSTASAADAQVIVSGSVLRLEITPRSRDLRLDESHRFSVRAVRNDGTTFELPRRSVEWSTDDRRVASVENAPGDAGRVTALSPGQTTITARHTDTRTDSDAAVVQVLGALLSLSVLPPDRRIDLGQTKSMTAMGTFQGGIAADVTDEVFWRSDEPQIVEISNKLGTRGQATAVRSGTAFISVRSVSGLTSTQSGGDALVRVPASVLSIRLAPDDITIPVNFSRSIEARGFFDDGFEEDVSNEVIWASSDPSVVSVSNVPGREGEITAHDTGAVIITAFHPDTGTSSSTSGGDVTVTVGGRAIALSVTPATAQLPLGLTRRFAVRASLDDGSQFDVPRSSVHWTSSNPAAAAVSNQSSTAGDVTALASGETTISATHFASELSSSESDGDAVVTVPGPIVALTVSAPAEELIAGETLPFLAEARFADGTVGDVSDLVDWTASHPEVATVTTDGRNRGLVTAIRNGDTSISVRDPASGVTSAATGGDASVTVRELLSLAVLPNDRRIELGDDKSMTAMGTLAGGSTRDLTDVVVWTSSAPSTVSVSNQRGRRGRATAEAPGTAFISATGPGGISSSDSNQDARVRVPADLVAVRINPGDFRLPVGFTRNLEAEGTFSDGSVSDVSNDVIWFTSAPSVALVSNAPEREGEVTAVQSGVAVISIVHPESGISSTAAGTDAVVDVAGRVLGIEVTPPLVELPVGLRQRFSARAVLDDGSTFGLPRRTLQWVTGHSSIATISNTPETGGTATAIARGETTVAAFHPDSGLRSTSSGGDAVLIVPGRLVSIEVRPQEREIFVGQVKRFSAFGLLDEGGEIKLSSDVEFGVKNESIARAANESGVRGDVTGLREGSTSVSVVHVPSGLSSTATGGDGTVIVAGVVESLRLQPSRLFVLRGTEQKLNLRATLDNGRESNVASDVVWTSSNESIAKVGNVAPRKGVLIAQSFGTATISAVEPASGTSTTATGGDGRVTVVEEVERLRVLDADLVLRTGDRPRLRAVGQFRDPAPLPNEPLIANIELTSRVEFTSSNPAVVRIEDGRALAVGLGEAVISAFDSELDISSSATGGDTVYRVTSALRSLKVKPRKIKMRVGQTRPRAFLAIGRYSDGARIDLTDQVEFTSNDLTVAAVTSESGDRGRVLPFTKGKSTVIAVEPVTGVQSPRRNKIIVKKAKR